MSFKLIGADDLQLYVNDYVIDKMKGIVLCIHGMCEHSNRYEDFALFLNKNGYSVYTYDHRGHGQSILMNENKGYLGIDGFNKMVYDMNVVVSYIKEKYPNEKIYLLGHSMGSFVTQRYIQLYDKADGVVLSGSNYGTKSLKAGRLMSKLACIFKGERKEAKFLEKLSFGSFNKHFVPNRTAYDWLSRDEKMVDLYVSDENCGYTCTSRFYYDFFGGLLQLSKTKNMEKINPQLPILIVSGDQDPVGNYGEGIKALYRVLRNHLSRVEFKLYSGARHEILNETNKNEVYHDILNWLTMIEE
ncbi:lysophospholipase [Mycoplasmatota bacterium]|nr:lysophospholipase [Mycoplasmatota bacterium]